MSRRELWRAAGFFLVLTLVFSWPLVLNLAGSMWPLGPDGNLFMWTLAWDVHAFTSHPWSIFDANILYPGANTLAYSENLIGSAFVAAPVLWLTGNHVLALNVVALFTCVMCGLGAYVLARRVGMGPAAAIIAGLVFAFSPPRFFRSGQLHLGAVEWIPFGLASLHAYLDGGRARDLRWAAVFFSLQALTSGHGAAFMTLGYAALLLYRVVLGERLAVVRRFRDLGIAGALALLPAALIFLPYRRVQQEMGLRRTLENWVVTPESFIASPSHLHQWVLSWFTSRPILDTASAFLFPGYLPLALALVALACLAVLPADTGATGWRDRARRNPVVFYFVLALLCVWLAIGPPLGLWPYVYNWPGLNLVRVPSRFTILGMLGLAMLAGFGFQRLTARLETARVTAMALVVGVLLLTEFAAFPMAVIPNRAEVSAADRWLARVSGPVVVAEVPLPDPRYAGPFERRQSELMLHTTAHWHKTVHGYSGFRPPQHDRLYEQMRSFPDAATLAAMADFGVTHIVVHTEWYGPGEWDRVNERIRASGNRLVLKQVAGSGRVYELQGSGRARKSDPD